MEKKKFYQKTWFIVLMLFLFAPIGIFLMWQNTNWNKIVKIALSILFGLIFVFALIGALGDDSNDTTDTTNTTQEQQVEEKESTQKEEKDTTEEESKEEESKEEETKEDKEKSSKKKEKKQSEAEAVYEMGQYWFQNINWDSVFPYKPTKVHYILDYTCQKTPDDFKKYGKYWAFCSADLSNAYGASFESHVYIFMDKNGVAKHVFYDEANGNSVEIPMDSIPMN